MRLGRLASDLPYGERLVTREGILPSRLVGDNPDSLEIPIQCHTRWARARARGEFGIVDWRILSRSAARVLARKKQNTKQKSDRTKSALSLPLSVSLRRFAIGARIGKRRFRWLERLPEFRPYNSQSEEKALVVRLNAISRVSAEAAPLLLFKRA